MSGRTSWGALAGVLLVSGTVVWILDALLGGGALVSMSAPWLTAVVLTLAAVWLFLRGRAVRNMVAGRPTTMTELGAARVVSFAKASSLTGALLGGVFMAATLVLATHPSAALRASLLPGTIAALASCLLLTVVAMVVEGWCRVPPEDQDAPPSSAQPA